MSHNPNPKFYPNPKFNPNHNHNHDPNYTHNRKQYIVRTPNPDYLYKRLIYTVTVTVYTTVNSLSNASNQPLRIDGNEQIPAYSALVGG